MPLKILLLLSLANLGDVSHVDGVLKFLKESTEEHRIDCSNIGNALKEALTFLNKNDKTIVYAVGDQGISCLQQLYKQNLFQTSSHYVIVGLHQYMDGLKGLPIDHIAMPKSAANLSDICVIPNQTLTFSIPSNNPSIEELKKTYENWALPNKPSLDKPYIIVMLPGDAPDPSSRIKLFTKESAKKLFEQICSLKKSCKIPQKVLIENSPRTGRFDSSGKILCDHTFKKGEKEPVDGISTYFISLLKQANIDFDFFNFSIEENGNQKIKHSSFKELLYVALSNPRNIFIAPGESMSLLSQLPLYLKPTQIIVFKPDSMNEVHESTFKSFVQKGYVSYFDEQGLPIRVKLDSFEPLKDDALIVATEILRGYKKKFP